MYKHLLSIGATKLSPYLSYSFRSEIYDVLEFQWSNFLNFNH